MCGLSSDLKNVDLVNPLSSLTILIQKKTPKTEKYLHYFSFLNKKGKLYSLDSGKEEKRTNCTHSKS